MDETTPAFITGSRKYGIPAPDSDLDLVVLMSKKDAEKLLSAFPGQANSDKDFEYALSSSCLYFGSLNLIVCTEIKDYKLWVKGTRILRKRAVKRGEPISRKEAVELFEKLRKNRGEE